MGRNKKKSGLKTKPQRVRRRTLKKIDKLKDKMDRSTPAVIDYVFREYEKLSKTEWDKFIEKLEGFRKRIDDREKTRFISILKFISEDFRNGDKDILGFLEKVFFETDYPNFREVDKILEKQKEDKDEGP